MGIFDFFHNKRIKELVFPRYNKNTFIVEHMAYIIDEDGKYYIILVKDFTT